MTVTGSTGTGWAGPRARASPSTAQCEAARTALSTRRWLNADLNRWRWLRKMRCKALTNTPRLFIAPSGRCRADHFCPSPRASYSFKIDSVSERQRVSETKIHHIVRFLFVEPEI